MTENTKTRTESVLHEADAELSSSPSTASLSYEDLLSENDRLRRELAEALSANQAKETFLSSMSHDIRTPMNAIVGMTALAQKYIDEKPRVQDALGKIEVASAHLLSLINDVLDMSRINSGRLVVARDRFFLSDLLHDTLIIVRPQAEQRGHTFRFTTSDILRESLYGDPLRLRQVFVNIINNAVKYTPEGGLIEVSFSQEAQGDRCVLIFTCKDNGVGMTPEFLSRIFEPFERANDPSQARIEGTGLGMSIVLKLVEAMGGTLSIDSEPGKGTLVSVRIPMDYENLSVSPAFLQNRRLLIAESDPQLLSDYRTYLADTGVECTFTASSQETVEAVTDAAFCGRPFDAVIIGNRIEGAGTLFDLAGYLNKARPDMPILLAGEQNWEEIEYRATRSGITAFVPVPFFRKTLVTALQHALDDTSGSANGSVVNLSGRRILLAEDNLINMEIAKELLSSVNADIETAGNGKEAVDLFCASPEGHFDLILMDVQMPVMDGYEATRAIRSCGRPDSDLPIYAMTANTFAEDIARAQEAGMNGHIAKPIDIPKLMSTLQQAFR